MSFRLAENSGKQPDYLAAAVYAFAYLFPDNPAQRRNELDPRIRTATNIYNRSLTSAFASADRSRVTLHSGAFALPFGSIHVYPAFEPSVVTIRGVSVALQAAPTAAFAHGRSDPSIWRSEYPGFLNGSLLHRAPSQLVGLEPSKAGLFPVVFIHGPASSFGRSANMINDLQADPVICDHFQFWLFSHNTGKPVPFSALQLRTAIESAVRQLEPRCRDPALQDMVLIGHSQGGLLAKTVVIDAGSCLWDAFSSKPLDQLRVSAETRDLQKRGAGR